jgi:SAM-dependent methyltransferase
MSKRFKAALRSGLRSAGFEVLRCRPGRRDEYSTVVRPEFRHIEFAGAAVQKLLDDFTFETVLDVGCGAGAHSEIFIQRGKKVTALDYGKSIYFEQNQHRMKTIIGDFNLMEFDQQYDCVWCSHILEHQVDVGAFLRKGFAVTKEGGYYCVTVPPLQHEILGGHVSVWNAGLLLYNLVLAGFDCREAHILRYNYNISAIVQKKSAVLPQLAYDNGDVNRIAPFLPPGLKEGFNGDIWSLNW